MSIKVYVHFGRALTNVVITDVRSGQKTELANVVADYEATLEPDDFDGEAKVRVSSTEAPQGEATLRNEGTFLYPPVVRSALNELAQFKDLDALAREIDKILKSTPSPAAKSSRAAKSSASVLKGTK
ncbi:hypothetical protein [Rhizobium anhuiense]|jgi:F420-dependent methylenetetrahydromethanopterin dehydrogenase|uniref:Uncharacterized protein n=1 Tax=Rhizobium anhuiense TaxID=1184720 RepID=A0A432NYD8_9HYPH|nr:hypothetical protein [Rhizobium anhuiense]KZS50720.1 hypothetical protein AS890_25195 [Rhizobium anhuiense bv. trifolii]RUM04697.1 hypothetical protein EEQ99_04085 [Rhizobium anhuiense]GGD69871.1 hypothetical protein GCM10008012_12510 [Rhizobium anhuiense]